MKRNNWFVCLAYPKFDILIPKEDIESSNFYSATSASNGVSDEHVFDWDALVQETSEGEVSGKNRTQLKIQGSEHIILRTSIIPDLISADLSDFSLFRHTIGQALLSRGFIATRFADNKIQYLTDVKKVIKNISGNLK